MADYNFISGQSEVRFPFSITPPVINIGSTVGALYTLAESGADYLENYDNLKIMAPEGYNYNDSGFPYNSFYFDNIHYISTNSSETGLTLEDLLKVNDVWNSPNAKYEIGVQFSVESFPTTNTFRWIIFTGTTSNYFGVKILPNGQVTYERHSGTATQGPYLIGTVANTDEWHSIIITHNQALEANCGVYWDGNFHAFNSSLKVDGNPIQRVTPILFGEGLKFTEGYIDPAWDSNSSAAGFTYSSDFLNISSAAGTGYGSAGITSVLTDTQDYYFELEYISGQYTWVGFSESDSNLNSSAALIGWVFATHNGRVWNHQTGGGTNFGEPIPVGSTIGIAYKGDTHQVTVYVDGVEWGTLPYSITGAIRPIIGRNNALDYKLTYKLSECKYVPAGTWNELPKVLQPVEDGVAPLFRGRMRWIRIHNALPGTTEIAAISNLGLVPSIFYVKSAARYDVTNLAMKWYADQYEILMYAPSLESGIYSVEISYNGTTQTIPNVNLTNFASLVGNVEYTEDFTDPGRISDNWFLAQRTWGAGNNGVAPELCKIYLANGEAYLSAHGDRFPGTTRVGSCLVSKKYFIPGKFTMEVKFPPFTGACCALWPFHYEEAYPGFPQYQELLQDGLSRQGNQEKGWYVVRNDEIDIETPTALMNSTESPSFVNGRFNSWVGELDEEYTSVFKPFFLNSANISDGNWHTLTIDWDRTSSIPKVSFIVDGFTTAVIDTHVPDIPMRMWIGIWFPFNWAGTSATWDSQDFICRSFKYEPYTNSDYREIPETYPLDGLVEISSTNYISEPIPPVVDPESIKIVPDHVEIYERETYPISVEVKPEGSWVVNLVSSDLTIAEVSSSGLISGVNQGKTQITASVGGKATRADVTVIHQNVSIRMTAIMIGSGFMSVTMDVGSGEAYTCQSYLDLVTNEHRKNKFLKFVEAGACPLAELSNTLDRAILAFDVDTAEGDQLNIIGEWVGAERVLAIDTEASALFFSFDVDGSGWDYAIWYEDFNDNIGLKAVPDKVYRLMVKAKIMTNMWNGTCEQANVMWKEVFNGSTIYFLDGFDMTMGVYVSGISLDSIIFELITQGYLAVKPEGVRIDYYIIGPEDPTAKTFAWGTETDIVGGWGVGYWSQRVPVIE